MSKIKTWNEATLDNISIWFERHMAKLDQIVEGVSYKKEADEHKRVVKTFTLDSTGSGSVLEIPAQGYDMVVERYGATITGASAATGVLEFYAESISLGNLLYHTPGVGGAQVFGNSSACSPGQNIVTLSDSIGTDGIYVPSGSQLVIAVAAFGSAGTCTINLQTRKLKKAQFPMALRHVQTGQD